MRIYALQTNRTVSWPWSLNRHIRHCKHAFFFFCYTRGSLRNFSVQLGTHEWRQKKVAARAGIVNEQFFHHSVIGKWHKFPRLRQYSFVPSVKLSFVVLFLLKQHLRQQSTPQVYSLSEWNRCSRPLLVIGYSTQWNLDNLDSSWCTIFLNTRKVWHQGLSGANALFCIKQAAMYTHKKRPIGRT